MQTAMLPWQWLSFQASFLQEWHLPFLGYTNIVHSLIVDEETKHHMSIMCLGQVLLSFVRESQNNGNI